MVRGRNVVRARPRARGATAVQRRGPGRDGRSRRGPATGEPAGVRRRPRHDRVADDALDLRGLHR